ncbi:M23 family metallopeptidase [Laspinema olomoucense]|uniref:M23 family metallopeptidase n=1 Tax=Laspinema olomoucense TaxID=3231600 RepID=UPI0021BA94D8|nr:M23 family metallopeptidase [Laspinema sp. D3d]MCT7971137.1 M23 family metallopeptidase [Laspinema sp. D3d]
MNTSLDILQRLPDEFQYRELKGIEHRTQRQLQEERDRTEAENQQFIANLESQAAQKERVIAEHHAAVNRGQALCAIASVTLLSFMVIPPLNRIAERTLKLYEWTHSEATTTATTASKPIEPSTDKTKPAESEAKVVPFRPLIQHRGPHFLDPSPPGSYDPVYFFKDDPRNSATPLPSPCRAKVVVSEFQGKTGGLKTGSGYGNVVILQCLNKTIQGKPLVWLTGHLASRSVKVGDILEKGQTYGVQGTTGRSSGVHAHHGIMAGFGPGLWRSYQITDRSITLPLMDEYRDFVATGGKSN